MKRKYSNSDKPKAYKKPKTGAKMRTSFPKRYRASIPEKKGMDTALTIAGPIIATTNTNADAFVLNLIQAGTGSWNRVGRKVHLKSVRLLGAASYIYSSQTTTADFEEAVLRMVVVWDKQPSGGALPTFETIFGTTDQSGTEASNVLAPPRYDNMDRFQVLRDCRIVAPVETVTAAAGTGNRVIKKVSFDEYLKLGDREVVFGGQTVPMTIADVSTGALYVYFRSTNSINDQTDWTITSNSYARLRYSD